MFKSIIISSLLLVVNQISSQEFIGFKLAPTLLSNSVNNAKVIESQNSNGLKIGFLYERVLVKSNSLTTSTLSFAAEPALSNQSVKYKTDASNIIQDKFSYLELPVFLRLALGDEIKFVTDLGLNPEFRSGFSQSATNNITNPKVTNGSLYGFNLNYVLGLGVTSDISRKIKLGMMLRRKANFSESNTVNQQEYSFNFMIFYNLGKDNSSNIF